MNFPYEIIMYVAGGIAIGALLVYAFMSGRQRELSLRLALQEQAAVEKMAMMEQSRQQLSETFTALSSEALSKNNQQFLTLATENLQRFQQKADASLQEKQVAIDQLVKPIAESLQKMDGKIADIEMKREGAYVELKTLVGSMKEQHALLHDQTASLAQALRAPTIRGQWGEMQLVRLLNLSGIQEGVHYTRQASAQGSERGMRPDVMVQLPPDKVLLLDAKVPMQNYLAAMQPDISFAEKDAYLTRHASDLKNHIKTLSAKEYTQGFDSFDWVIMFVPLDGLIQTAFDKLPDLIEYAWSKNVMLATPTNLLGLMRTVSYAHDRFKINENAKEIAKIGESLYKRVSTFAGHMVKMGNALDSAMGHYNNSVGSLESTVLSGLRQFKTLGVASNEDTIPSLKALEKSPRRIAAPELIAAQEDL